MTPSRRLFFRSLLIQALWNPRDFQGSGVGWALSETPGVFNGHPYLSGIALGALARLRKIEGGENGGPLDTRFREALRAPLGALGDSLVWVGFRPLALLATVALLLLGVSPLLALPLLLLGFNAVQLGLRAWGVRIGLTHGLNVGMALRAGSLHRWARGLQGGGVVSAGAVTGILVVALIGAWVPGSATEGAEAGRLLKLLVVPALVALLALVAGGSRLLRAPHRVRQLRLLPLVWTLGVLGVFAVLSIFNLQGA
jgi:mannose/fructose/N-acetylgalactosamine-specific phosphotransferase system component IID